MSYRIGIDLGGTNIVAAVVDENYKIISKSECLTNLPRDPNRICDDMANISQDAIKKASISLNDISSVGIGAPGIINPKTGFIEYSCNFNYHNVNLTQMMNERLSKDIFIENDANAAAIGEFASGAGKDVSNMIAITLGTGLGGGIIINNKIYSGFNYAGGELGHMVIKKDGRPCNCGRNGCYEAYASASGLILTTNEIMGKNKDSVMWKLSKEEGKVSGKTAFQGARLGDQPAKEVVSKYISDLACGVLNIINIFQPELISIGGGISKEGDNLLNPLIDQMGREEYSKDSKHRCKIKIAKLGNDAGLVGAAFADIYQ